MGTPETILRVGVVGCGNIVEQYLQTLPHLGNVRLVAAADLDPARAEAVAARVDGARALSVDELIADPEVDLVLNLTIPAVHHEIALKAIAAGKQVYGEKPLADTVAHAREILAAAEAAGITVGSAPDTVLGSGIQTARKAVDDGLIGRPIAATATMTTPGHERWHPNPDFYYQPGGGPLLDMGPYYVTALITLLGPVTSVIGAASSLRDERTIGSGPRAGETVPVNIDTHVTGVLVHESGVLSTLVMSFDTVASRASRIEVHGEQGSLVVPDPNNFDGATELKTLGDDEWQVLDQTAGYVGVGRGIGLQDLALANGSPRASGAVAFHALEVMESLVESAHTGRSIAIESTCERPSAVPLTTIA
ncbi:oxidoreductase [Microbacterium sorbitolivorans]|uniref:Gfo/Idh/MocA family protein n=1 Tax=Microbacterium sorbitolivorans TaxID=1867410 RepID=UPI00165193A0|nr:Gfo/Idh/MocA family oxidoreductase [Microbacterium sorbitolivorans]GGF44659.1 oxidoreductase [Microbacterium sorbitolivorans]